MAMSLFTKPIMSSAIITTPPRKISPSLRNGSNEDLTFSIKECTSSLVLLLYSLKAFFADSNCCFSSLLSSLFCCNSIKTLRSLRSLVKVSSSLRLTKIAVVLKSPLTRFSAYRGLVVSSF